MEVSVVPWSLSALCPGEELMGCMAAEASSLAHLNTSGAVSSNLSSVAPHIILPISGAVCLDA